MGEVSKAVGQWIVGNVGWTVVIFLFILSGLFKIAKVELNPVGWLVTTIGNVFNKSLRDEIIAMKNDTNLKILELRKDLDAFEVKTNASVDEMKNGTVKNCELLKLRLNEIEKSNDMQTIRQIKAHVLDFANSCRNGVKHTKEDFVNVMNENAEYESLITKYGLKNDVYREDYKFIVHIYQHCLEENSFLA